MANDGDRDISAYALDPSTGTLTAAPGTTPFSGSGPITTDPSGKYVYAADSGGSSVLAFTVDPVSGALTVVSGSPFTGGFLPTAIAADPSGRFLYTVNGDGTITVLGIDPNTGALASLGNLPSRAGTSMAITSGTAPVAYVPQFAYVANAGLSSGSNNISGYSINASTGALSAVSSSPFAEGFSPTSIFADPLAPYLRPSISNYTTGKLINIIYQHKHLNNIFDFKNKNLSVYKKSNKRIKITKSYDCFLSIIYGWLWL